MSDLLYVPIQLIFYGAILSFGIAVLIKFMLFAIRKLDKKQ